MDAFVAIDFETADPAPDSACAVGLCRVEAGKVVYRDAVLLRPPRPVVTFTHVHGLTWQMVKDADPFGVAWPKLAGVLDGARRLVAHNAPFDRKVLAACCAAARLPVPVRPWVCTLALARARWPRPYKNTLPDVCERLGVPLGKHHEAGADAEACARVLIALEEESHEGRGRAARAAGAGLPGDAPGVPAGLPAGPGRTGADGGGDDRVRRVVAGPGVLPAAGGGPGGAGGAAAEAAVRRLAGGRADRLIADAVAGGWLRELAGWVGAWAAGQRSARLTCPRCGGRRTWMADWCSACVYAEEP